MADVAICQESKAVTVKGKDGKPRVEYKLVCGLAAQDDSAFCPRHTFLRNIDAQKKAVDAANRRDAKAAGADKPGPRTRRALIAAGYQFTGSSDCRACRVHIEWWRTPNGNKQPYNPMPLEDSFALTHFVTCTRAEQFRRAS